MTRRIGFVDPLLPRLNATSAGILVLIAARVDESGPWASVGVREVSRLVGANPPSARKSLRRLREERLVEYRPVFLPNGGQAESEYSLTGLGRRVVGELGNPEAVTLSSRETARMVMRLCDRHAL